MNENYGRRADDNGKQSPQFMLGEIHTSVLNLQENGKIIAKQLIEYKKEIKDELVRHQADDDTKFGRLNDSLQVNFLANSQEIKRLSEVVNKGVGSVQTILWLIATVIAGLGVFAVIKFH